jgi:hypothetical protein
MLRIRVITDATIYLLADPAQDPCFAVKLFPPFFQISIFFISCTRTRVSRGCQQNFKNGVEADNNQSREGTDLSTFDKSTHLDVYDNN